MFHNNEKIPGYEFPDSFADLFDIKVQNTVHEQVIVNEVFNCKRKIKMESLNFMTENDVLKAVKSLKPKNYEGHP